METAHIDHTLDRLESIYEKHILSFDEEILPDLEAQIEERRATLSVLKETMAEFLPDPSAAEDWAEVHRLTGRFEKLKHQITLLISKVEVHRNDLEQGMKQMVQGKQAIHAYGSPGSLRNRPRVITVRN